MTYNEIIELTRAGIEIWKPIKGFEGYYEISNFGHVKTVERFIISSKRTFHIKENIKKPYIGSCGYYYISLCKEGKQFLTTIHRLIAQTFIPNPKNKPHVDHINANPQDFRLENLRWATHKENANNEFSMQKRRNNTYTPETVKRGMQTRKMLNSKNGAKTVYQYTKEGDFIKEYYSMAEAKRETGAGHICEVLDDDTQTSGGFLWTSTPIENLRYHRAVHSAAKAVQQYDMAGNLIGEWPSISEAAKQTGLYVNTISRNIKAFNPTKYKFKYKDGA